MDHERTATKAREALDRDCWTTQLSVNQILNVLRDYIPQACLRDAEIDLFDAFFINGTELTSNTMRKEYEAWKQTQIDIMMLGTKP